MIRVLGDAKIFSSLHIWSYTFGHSSEESVFLRVWGRLCFALLPPLSALHKMAIFWLCSSDFCLCGVGEKYYPEYQFFLELVS